MVLQSLPSRRDTRLSFTSSLVEQARIAYYRYEVTFALYVMNPGERMAFNSSALMVLSLLMLPTMMYLPQLVAVALDWLLCYAQSINSPLPVSG